MTDSYLGFANSSLGSRIVSALGLPQPMHLERYQANEPVIRGRVLLGGGDAPQLLHALALCFRSMSAQTVAHRSLTQWTRIAGELGLMSGPWGGADKPDEKLKAWFLTPQACSPASSPMRCTTSFTRPRARCIPAAGCSCWAVRRSNARHRARPPYSALLKA